MADLSQVSDDELLASLPRGVRNNNPLNLKTKGSAGSDGTFARYNSMDEGLDAADRNLQAYHTKHGINTVGGVINRWAPPVENDTGAYANRVASKLGVRPDEPIDMTDPATRRALLGAMAEHENGVPVNTGNDLSSVSDAELLASLGGEAGDTVTVGRSHNGGVTVELPRSVVPQPKGGKPKPAPKPSTWEDAAMSGLSGLRTGMAGLADVALAGSLSPMSALGWATSFQKNGLPPMGPFSNIASQIAADRAYKPKTTAGQWANTAGTMAPAAALGGGGIVQRLANVILPTVGAEGSAQTVKAMGGNERAQNIARLVGGVAGGLATGIRAPKQGPRIDTSVESAYKAQDEAWKAVDASGYRFPRQEIRAAADDIANIVDEADPELYAESAKIARKVGRMADRGELSPAQANRLRSQIGEKLLQPGSTEASVGNAIKARIDALIDTAAGESKVLSDARQKYTTYLKLKDVTGRLEDAGINQSASGTGGNVNAARQALKPLVKNRSAQRWRNGTPDEMAALKGVVNGTPTQNAARAISAFDPFHGRLGMLIQGGLGLKTAGASLATIPIGMGATMVERALASKNIQRALQTVANGGVAPPSAALSYSPQYPALAAGLPAMMGLTVPVAATAKPAPGKTSGQRKQKGR